MTLKKHFPTPAESDKVDATATAITTALLEEGLGPGYAGAVMTVCMAHILALLNDDTAKEAMRHHLKNAWIMRKLIKASLNKGETMQ